MGLRLEGSYSFLWQCEHQALRYRYLLGCKDGTFCVGKTDADADADAGVSLRASTYHNSVVHCAVPLCLLLRVLDRRGLACLTIT